MRGVAMARGAAPEQHPVAARLHEPAAPELSAEAMPSAPRALTERAGLRLKLRSLKLALPGFLKLELPRPS